MTQEQAIIKYLKTHKKATGLDFMTKLGILCYTKVIARIRRDFDKTNEYAIHTELQTVKTRYGKTKIGVYSLVKLGKKRK